MVLRDSKYYWTNEYLSGPNLVEATFTVVRDSKNILRTLIVSQNQISSKRGSRF